METTLENAFSLIRLNAPLGTVAGPAEDGTIIDAERELSVNLTTEYKVFLKEFGALRWPEYVCGLGNRLYPAQKLIAVTKEERSEVEPALLNHLIPISPDGWGNHYCLDTSRGSTEICPVVLWDHNLSSDQELPILYSSFGDFLLFLVQQRLQFDRDNP